jgi:hypothetical protein
VNCYSSRMQHLQPLSPECCWWMKHASHGIEFWTLVTTMHGMMKIHIPFEKRYSSSSLQKMIGWE